MAFNGNFPNGLFLRSFPALEQVQGGGFADMANAIQLIFRDYIGNGIPVDCVFFHDNTPHILISFAGIRTVRVLPRRNKFRLLRFSQSENQSPASLFLLSAKSHARLACSVVSALTTAHYRYQLFAVFLFREIMIFVLFRVSIPSLFCSFRSFRSSFQKRKNR